MRICLHTLLHTDNNHDVSRINAGLFMVVCSHNPLVRSSTLRGGTIKTMLHPLRCIVDVLSAPTARNSIAYTVWQSSNTCLALSQRD